MARILDRTVADGDCLIFTGHTKATGYGYAQRNGRTTMAHRIAYEEEIGPIPEGLELDHLCRRRNCVNPEHMEPVTPTENKWRAAGWRDGHCKRGHDLASSIAVTPSGVRRCRPCALLNQAAAYQRRKHETADR